MKDSRVVGGPLDGQRLPRPDARNRKNVMRMAKPWPDRDDFFAIYEWNSAGMEWVFGGEA